jgi:sarcosine oxidase subunit gamma
MPDTVAPDRLRPQDATPGVLGPLDDLRRVVVPGRLLMQPAPGLGRLALRGDPAALGAAFGLALPTQPCRATQANGRSALWLGPDEWLLLAPPGTLDAGVSASGAAVVDVGHRQVGLWLDGPGGANALSAGCPLDLHPTAFPVGMCTRTVFGKAEIVLWRPDAARFHVEVWRSFAAYVHGLLEQALR